jgi:Cu-Zn family superoxide dismutase
MDKFCVATFTGTGATTGQPGPGIVGQVVFREKPPTRGGKINGTLVSFHLSGFGPNQTHAVHVHEFGDMGQGCKSLGGHWNPTNRQHGNHSLDGDDRHAGDMCNEIHSNKYGVVKHKYVDHLIHVDDILGRSVVIHSGRDDLGRGGDAESLISGNAGSRIACAVIGRAATLPIPIPRPRPRPRPRPK